MKDEMKKLKEIAEKAEREKNYWYRFSAEVVIKLIAELEFLEAENRGLQAKVEELEKEKNKCPHYLEYTWGEPPDEPDGEGQLHKEFECKLAKHFFIAVGCEGDITKCNLPDSLYEILKHYRIKEKELNNELKQLKAKVEELEMKIQATYDAIEKKALITIAEIDRLDEKVAELKQRENNLLSQRLGLKTEFQNKEQDYKDLWTAALKFVKAYYDDQPEQELKFLIAALDRTLASLVEYKGEGSE